MTNAVVYLPRYVVTVCLRPGLVAVCARVPLFILVTCKLQVVPGVFHIGIQMIINISITAKSLIYATHPLLLLMRQVHNV